jgi:hypothetical protein
MAGDYDGGATVDAFERDVEIVGRRQNDGHLSALGLPRFPGHRPRTQPDAQPRARREWFARPLQVPGTRPGRFGRSCHPATKPASPHQRDVGSTAVTVTLPYLIRDDETTAPAWAH